ncbi:hypothetical protein [Haliea sp. E17]|uniref:hypothetical protein n=1 Tax=Haliea sp. E17 TaxID=3401576 RepID=UPI003AAB18E2
MKSSASVLAVLTLTSQLALADTPAETTTQAGESAVVAGSQITTPAAPAATDSQIKSLERDLRPSLQSRLDAQMDFAIESRALSREAIASVD